MNQYPVHVDSVYRPFRLWNPVEQACYRWRYYADWKRACIGALVEAKWAKVGTTVEVIDIRTGRLLGQYTRTIDSIRIHNEVTNVRAAQER